MCVCVCVQGVVNTSEGKVVRAFHRFTLVDQTGTTHTHTHTGRRPRAPLQTGQRARADTRRWVDSVCVCVCVCVCVRTGQGRDLTKGRTREAGAVKISCARLDPNARNCHGYRKFVKRSILEDPSRGYLVNDTIIIKYTIELVVSSGEWRKALHPMT